jgi:hypothetical protein
MVLPEVPSGARLHALEVGHVGDRRTVVLDVALPAGIDAPDLIGKLAEVENILEVRWTD